MMQIKFWRAVFIALGLFHAQPALAKSPKQDIVPLALTTKAVALAPGKPAIQSAGPLRYMGGLHVTADSHLFGGLSGLALSPDGKVLIAIADTGYWFIADLIEDEAGRLIGLKDGVMADLLRPDGLAPQGYAQSDAEALSLDVNAGIAYVSFESRHRVWSYAFDPEQNPRQLLRTPSKVVDDAGALSAQPTNGGIESLFWYQGAGLFALSEELGDKAWGRVGWRLMPGPPIAFRYQAPLPYVPTDVAILPDGRLLILNRRASFFSGFSTKLVLAHMPPLEAGETLAGTVIAKLGGSLIADNFEGAAARRDGQGRTVIYLVSDDNFSRMQRTLLLKFALEEAEAAPSQAMP